MLHPTIDELTKGKFNRYELALATARCARLITDEYVRQHEAAERAQTGNKETDRPINTMIDRELRDEKAVKVAIRRIANGDFIIDENAADYEPIDLAAEHEAEMQSRYPDFSDDEDDEEDDDAFAEEDEESSDSADVPKNDDATDSGNDADKDAQNSAAQEGDAAAAGDTPKDAAETDGGTDAEPQQP